MSLTWFPFNADAYTGDTGHLTCEEHGAYLLLMLAYYRSEKPLPARDRSLAATAKLSLDAWMEAKHSLAPFFREADGLWHHDVIEETIRTQSAKIEVANTRAAKGAEKRWAGHVPKRSRKDAPSNASSIAPSIPKAVLPAMPVDCSVIADLDKDNNSLSTRERERDLGGEEPQEPQATEPGIGSPIGADWKPLPEWVAETVEAGFTETEIYEQVALFIAHKQESGQFSNNWDASWVKGWDRYKQWKAKQKPKGAPRIVVNSEHVPSDSDYDKAMAMFAKGMRWHRGIGPQPGDLGCKCPIEIIEKYGFDPKTGMKVRK